MNDITGLSGLGVGELMQKYVEANMEVQNHIIASSFGKEGQEAADNLRLLENELLRRLTLNKELVDAIYIQRGREKEYYKQKDLGQPPSEKWGVLGYDDIVASRRRVDELLAALAKVSQ